MKDWLRARGLLGLLWLLRLPELPPVGVDEETERAFTAAADALLAGETNAIPERRLDFLRWLPKHRPVVFHGSPHGDLAELSTERRSKDTTEWGNQQAVYATPDPVWAIYFACLRRDAGWTGTRNGSMGKPDAPLYPRRYFFVHNRGSESPDRFGPGSLHLLPPDSFVADAPLAGVVDTAHLVSHSPVKPLARVNVTPDDFPFVDRLGYFEESDSILVTMLRAARANRRRRPTT